MEVETSDSKIAKKLCCLYCKKSVIALWRHLSTVHKYEPDVQKFIKLPKGIFYEKFDFKFDIPDLVVCLCFVAGTKERKDIIAVIRKRGRFIHNSDRKINKGRLQTARRPNSKRKKGGAGFITCAACQEELTKTSIRYHMKRCTNVVKGQRMIQVLGRAIEGRLHPKATDRLRLVVFPVLREDSIVRLIRYDWLIISYGNILCMKYIPHYQHNLIRARLRLAGRLLSAIKVINSDVMDFASIYHPKFYDALVDAIRLVAGYDPILNEFRAPATASAAVTHVKQIAVYLIAEYIKRDEPENQRHTENFLKLMQSDISVTINKTVLDQQGRMRREKQEKIPSTDDIKKFAEFIGKERQQYFNELSAKFSFQNWFKLAELTMASIIIFNRRRTGEVQNILSVDFTNRESINENTELFKSLSEQSKQIARRYSRMKIRGKKARTVAVLLTTEIDQCIQLLVQHRKNAKIAEHNHYLFALPTCYEFQIRVVDAVSAIRKFSELCGAADPQSLRGTTMRKHMATICISMELNDNSVAELADFMGHHEKIHREYYRQNPIEGEIVKISQLLEKAQGVNDNERGHFDNRGSIGVDPNDVSECLGVDFNDVSESLGVDPAANLDESDSDASGCEMDIEVTCAIENDPVPSRKASVKQRIVDSDDSNDGAAMSKSKLIIYVSPNLLEVCFCNLWQVLLLFSIFNQLKVGTEHIF